MSMQAPNITTDAQPIACPKCCASLVFSRSPAPRVDACGFETYYLQCGACRTELAGVIDPADDMLLLSTVPG